MFSSHGEIEQFLNKENDNVTVVVPLNKFEFLEYCLFCRC